jgi:hypothetical protein
MFENITVIGAFRCDASQRSGYADRRCGGAFV